jgi:hypothetical protein
MDEKAAVMKRIDEIVEKGGIVADVFTHFHESDAEKLKNAAVAFATAVKQEQGVVFSLSEIAAPEKQGDEYTTYVETRIVVSDIKALANVMMKYTPVGMEIVRPDVLKMQAIDVRDAMMTVANNIFDLRNYVFNKVMTPEEKAKITAYVVNKMKEAEKLRKEGGNHGASKG